MAWADVYSSRAEQLRPSLFSRLWELLWAHAVPAAFFGFFCGVKAMFALHGLQELGTLRGGSELSTGVLKLTNQVLGLSYFGLIAFCCATRLPKQSGRRGAGTVAAALFASFSIMLIGLLPDRRWRPEVELAGSMLLAAGMAYSIWSLAFLRRSFRFVIFDLGAQLGEVNLTVLERVDQILVLATSELSSLKDVKEVRRILRYVLRVPESKVMVALNHRAPGGVIDRAAVEVSVGHPLLCEFSFEGAKQDEASMRGEILSVVEPEGPMAGASSAIAVAMGAEAVADRKSVV